MQVLPIVEVSMKFHFLLPLAATTLFFISGCQPPEGWTTTGAKAGGLAKVEIEFKDGLAYEKGSTQPFSGQFIETYEDADDKIKVDTTYVDGLKSGAELHYRRNGKIAREYGFSEGIARYVLVRYDSGLAKMISFYEDNSDPAAEKFIGPHVRFHENGFPGTNGIWAADHKQWNKRFMQWDTKGLLLGDYLFDEGRLKEIYFETEIQQKDREERDQWNKKNLGKKTAVAEPEADQ